MAPLPTTAAVQSLPAHVRGRVRLPYDTGFHDARRPWNLAIAQDVAAVVEAADADDVASLVRFARARGIAVATQPSGHGATGRTGAGILLRTNALDTVEIDPTARTARIGAGVRSGALQRAAAEHGLTALPGSSPVVTVAGAALGGGLSWFGRRHGWMADSVRAFDVVTADGAAAHVTAETDPELLWALRGGGGDLAIVTGLELCLHRAPSVFGGRQLWPMARARDVARAFRAVAESAPAELTVWLELLNFPGADPMIAIDSTFLGNEDEARRLLRETDALPAPLSDSRAAMSAAELGTITAEPTDPAPGRSRAELLARFDDDAIDALVDVPIAPLAMVQIRQLGGALARPSDSPHGALQEPYAAYMFGVPTSPALANAIAERQSELADALPATGRKPLSFLAPSEQLADALPAASIARIARLKAQRDPAGTIRGNFSVWD